MNVFEIIAGIFLILTSIAIIVLVMLQDSTDSMSSAVTGDASQSYFNNNRGRTREEKLKKFTKICVIVFLVITLAVGVVSRFVG
ncbi:MAG: preprotein translocase subunit SecG [Oscillospiraceae bacterium]|nr:preprotein translocase subunit SecG [Oscillospiraceae bacterium]